MIIVLQGKPQKKKKEKKSQPEPFAKHHIRLLTQTLFLFACLCVCFYLVNSLYIYDYCVKRNFQAAASAFASEAQVGPDVKVPYDSPEGFLYEWFNVFWDCWNASQPQQSSLASKDAVSYMEVIASVVAVFLAFDIQWSRYQVQLIEI